MTHDTAIEEQPQPTPNKARVPPFKMSFSLTGVLWLLAIASAALAACDAGAVRNAAEEVAALNVPLIAQLVLSVCVGVAVGALLGALRTRMLVGFFVGIGCGAAAGGVAVVVLTGTEALSEATIAMGILVAATLAISSRSR